MSSFERFNYRAIIAEAWGFTQQNKRLIIWYSFIPSILTTLVGVLYLGYQFFAFKRSELFDNAAHSFLYEVITTTISFFRGHVGLIVPALIIGLIFGFLYLVLPTLTLGGLVQIIARRRKGIQTQAIEGFSLGMLVFLPLFEFFLLIKTFSVYSVLTEGGFVIRNLGVDALRILLPFFVVFAFLGLLLSLLLTYSEFFIILEKKGILASMGASIKLMILNWQHTFLVGVLMLIISLRVILNIIAVLLIPALIVVSTGFIAAINLQSIGIVIGGAVGIISLLFASYFNAIIHMFATTVWTYTFLALRAEQEAVERAEQTTAPQEEMSELVGLTE